MGGIYEILVVDESGGLRHELVQASDQTTGEKIALKLRKKTSIVSTKVIQSSKSEMQKAKASREAEELEERAAKRKEASKREEARLKRKAAQEKLEKATK